MIDKNAEVVKFLLDNKDEDFNINCLAKGLKLDYKSAHNIIKRLENKKIITLKQFGKTNKIEVNYNCNPIIYQAEYMRKEEILKNKNFKTMLDYFKNASSKFYILLLFGSHAKKTQTKSSDIDLMFIIPDNNDATEKSINSIASTIPLNLHINIYKESEFKSMKNSKIETVGSEAIKNSIILYGIEAYYELIK